MKCPYCNEEMQHGTMSCDGRGGTCFVQEGVKRTWGDALAGVGIVKAKSPGGLNFWRVEIEGDYCEKCKKLILDAEVSK